MEYEQMKRVKKKEHLQVEVVDAWIQQYSYKKFLWTCIVAVIFLTGNLVSFFSISNDLEFSKIFVILAALMGLVIAIITEHFAEKLKWIVIVRFFPVLLLLLFGPWRCWEGMRVWLNEIITGWNRLRQGGMVLFAGDTTESAFLCFAMICAMLFGELTWIMIRKENLLISWIYGVFWIFIMLAGNHFEPIAVAMLLSGLFGANLFQSNMQIRRSGVISFVVIFAVCMIGAFLFSDQKMDTIEDTRKNIMHSVHELRYGKDQLPEGKLSEAYKLNISDQEMMKVIPEDKKTLYLKAYVGSIYENGVWGQMPDSVYGGENAGLIRWLKSKGFDPLKQSAQYQELSDQKEKTDKNHVKIEVTGASRYYFYAPASLESISKDKAKSKMDITMLSKGFLGQNKYQWTEISSTRPSELTVAEEWVTNPKNAKQKQYSDAEAVYRKFVYENYTIVDKHLIKAINQIFWKDYHSKSDGIYSALNQVRTKLRQNYRYTKSPEITPEGKDPIEWFLTTSHKGNQMLYASAAVEAFRVHGIPARYVEGYYVGASRMEESSHGKVAITGKNAHAWVEVYFDGIGWKAIDVTPGYYYNVATLQKMVNTPEKIKKNAALKNNGYKGKQTTDSGRRHSNAGEKAKKIVKNIAMLVVGIFMILIILGVILFAFIEIRFIILERRKAKHYENADMDQKIGILQKEIFGLFTIFGIEARLGWNTKQTDEILSSQFESIEEGDYERVCELMEKTIYGEITLELYEERTIRTFRDKLVESAEHKGWRDKIRFQYRYYKYCC